MVRHRRFWLVGAQLVAGLTLAGYALASGPGAGADPTFAAVNGTVQGSALHEIVGSSAFPNYVTGAVDNQYPLAHAHVDNSPFAEATASPADTGPLGQTLATAPTSPPGALPIPPGQAVQQPQYADAKAPPGTAGHPVTVGSPNGPYASASADENTASARAGILSTTSATGSSTASATGPVTGPTGGSTLRTRLAAWRNRWLSADDAHRYPLAAASTPDGSTGDSADSDATFDPHTGLLTLTSDARVAEASYGGGLIVLKDLHLAVRLTNDGTTPRHSVSVEVGAATVAGVPVTINQDGVAINGQQVPGIGSAVQSADQDLNAALRQSGYQVFTVAPTVTRSSGQETVQASGVHISFVQPNAAPGVPQQKADNIIGEVFADALAQPGVPLTEQLPAPSTESVIAAPAGQPATGTGLTGTGSATESTGSPAVTPPSRPAANPVASGPLSRVVRNRPTWLLWAYLLWQISILGTAASLWWWRQEAPA